MTLGRRFDGTSTASLTQARDGFIRDDEHISLTAAHENENVLSQLLLHALAVFTG